MKIVFIDGPQRVGKSTLINKLSEKYGFEYYKFPFSEYTKKLGFIYAEELRGFQVGKDLSALYWLSHLGDSNKTILVDRGPMSTAYYSISNERMSGSQLDTFMKEISSFGDNFIYIFVDSKNGKILSRNKGDGFDKLDSGGTNRQAVTDLISSADWAGIKLNIFINDFSKSVDENSERLYKVIEEAL